METSFPEYPKIYGPFKRHADGPNRNQVIHGEWSRPEFADLAGIPWLWTEKIDGTNIRVLWDGHKVTIGGRTARAQLHADLVAHLTTTLTEELFEQTFGDSTALLHGEGFGAGIQKGGGAYSPTKTFALFDVQVGDYWLLRDNVEDIATKMGVPTTPVVMRGTVQDAIDTVNNGLRSKWGDFEAEGLVGTPPSGLLDRAGRRIMMKVKAADFSGDQ
ncbi:hypothetical protein GTQ99_00505 [Kineococcus sp. T13]|uniref:RNA ligase family protein n=1 Tax=Kineococcus vitellinus TaxID=2696565 RepID=UPI001412F20C|nr:RNA ligase family protein [Kineococcus vitellinus]NAZ73912.1 hypothetical protein [Kineococcus vitellinus]